MSVTSILEDVRYAGRGLRQHPALVATVIATLGLAIGANSAIFTVVNAVLLRPLPYSEPERVVMLFEVDPSGRDSFVSVPTFEDWQRTLETFTGLSLVGGQTANLTGVAEPDRLRAGFVTAGFFDMLGVPAIIGRTFVSGEDRAADTKTAVLMYRTWRARFGGDPSIVGRALILNNEPHEVVGILPPTFEFPIDDFDVWLPYSALPIQERERDSRNTMVVGRLRRDVPVQTAQAELRQTAGDLARAFPATHTNWSARFEPFHDVTVRLVARNLRLLWGAVVFVLLIACANVANLLLARASARQREMAVRSALGASRARLVRQLLIESIVMAAVGGTLGLVLGALLTDGMLTLLPNLPRADGVAPDTTVILFTAMLSIATGLIFGMVPALRTSRPDLRAALNEGGRGGESRATSRWRGALVVGELALSLVLLVAAGLFIQSLTRLMTVDLGYDPENLLTLEYRLPRNRYSSADAQWNFHRTVIERIAQVRGVTVTALARAIPQSGNGGFVGFWRSEDARPAPEAMPRAQYNVVSPEYFTAMRIAVYEGRVCRTADTPDTPLALIVNRLLAERLWPSQSPVGKRLRAPDFPGEAVIVGVVGNTRPQLLTSPMQSQIYGCLSQQPGIFASVIVKTAGEPMALARSVQRAVWSVDSDQPVWKIRSSESLVRGSVQTQRFVMLLMSLAAGLALLLAGLGTYGVLSYNVQRRTREVGVRMALGATRANIVRLVIRQTAWLTLTGIAIGLTSAVVLSRLIAAQLYEVSPRDPATMIVTAMTLAGVALTAAWLPARRATRIDSMVSLRGE
jgi:putative ABC transport system permease protein